MLHTYILPFPQQQDVLLRLSRTLRHQGEGAGGGEGGSYHPHPPPPGVDAGRHFRDMTRGKFRGSEPGLPV